MVSQCFDVLQNDHHAKSLPSVTLQSFNFISYFGLHLQNVEVPRLGVELELQYLYVCMYVCMYVVCIYLQYLSFLV